MAKCGTSDTSASLRGLQRTPERHRRPPFLAAVNNSREIKLGLLLDLVSWLRLEPSWKVFAKGGAGFIPTPKDVQCLQLVIAETISEIEDPKEVICEAVEKFKVDILVLRNQEKGALKRSAKPR